MSQPPEGGDPSRDPNESNSAAEQQVSRDERRLTLPARGKRKRGHKLSTVYQTRETKGATARKLKVGFSRVRFNRERDSGCRIR